MHCAQLETPRKSKESLLKIKFVTRCRFGLVFEIDIFRLVGIDLERTDAFHGDGIRTGGRTSIRKILRRALFIFENFGLVFPAGDMRLPIR